MNIFSEEFGPMRAEIGARLSSSLLTDMGGGGGSEGGLKPQYTVHMRISGFPFFFGLFLILLLLFFFFFGGHARLVRKGFDRRIDHEEPRWPVRRLHRHSLNEELWRC